MLLAAQERARYSGIELRPGEGEWWTTTPRFGGAANDGILDDLINNSHGMSFPDLMMEEGKPASPASEAESARKRHKFEHYASGLSRRPSAMRKLSNSEKWKILQPGTSLWDKRMKYMQIGKVPESPFDDVCGNSPPCLIIDLTLTCSKKRSTWSRRSITTSQFCTSTSTGGISKSSATGTAVSRQTPIAPTNRGMC
jgi:hypothetical protein